MGQIPRDNTPDKESMEKAEKWYLSIEDVEAYRIARKNNLKIPEFCDSESDQNKIIFDLYFASLLEDSA